MNAGTPLFHFNEIKMRSRLCKCIAENTFGRPDASLLKQDFDGSRRGAGDLHLEESWSETAVLQDEPEPVPFPESAIKRLSLGGGHADGRGGVVQGGNECD